VPPIEPIPETVQALDELDAPVDTDQLLDDLRGLARRGREIVPDLVGVSIARPDSGLTFTLVATDVEIALLDAVQYAAGGPCVDSAEDLEVREFENDDVLDEERWLLFAEATAAKGVRSTLTLPVVVGDDVVGTINLYASSRHAFAAHHEELAELFGALAAGAVANADLPFATRGEAQAAPARAREISHIETAIGILSAQLGVTVEAAEDRLRQAAAQAGVSPGDLALHIIAGRDL
jgi:GAF domain-containing protein